MSIPFEYDVFGSKIMASYLASKQKISIFSKTTIILIKLQ